MLEKIVAQEPQRGYHCRADLDNDDQVNGINVIFGDSLSIASKTQVKKLERDISLAQHNELETRMKWSKTNISFGFKDHPEIEPYNQNLPFVVKVPIRCHKVAKTLRHNEASLNVIMRKTFVEMDLNLSDLTPVQDMFHGGIPRQSSTPIRRTDLKVFIGSRDKKCKETLILEVTRLNIGYTCILRGPFLLKFMVVIHTTYATMKMNGPKGVITIKAN
jgi:hypothetical protein